MRFEYTGRKPDDSAFFDQAFQFLLQQFSIKSCYIKYDRYLIKILEKYNFHFVSTEMYDEDLLVYYPFGVLYKIEDITADKFYIGMTENLKMWDRYMGSGVALKAYLKKYPYKQNPQEGDHIYRKIILRDNFDTPDELRAAEKAEILKYATRNEKGHYVIDDPRCLNIKIGLQNSYLETICPECGEILPKHKKYCSYIKKYICPECGARARHKKYCSHYNLGRESPIL